MDEKFKIKNKSLLKQKYNNRSVVRERREGTYSRNEIREFMQKRSDELKLKGNYSISVSIHDENHKWVGGYITTAGSRVIVGSYYDTYDDDGDDERDDEDTIDKFDVYILQNLPTAGGTDKDKNNNCLYYCLKNVLGETFKYKKPSTLKRVLDIQWDQPIDISYIPLIEKKLKIKINVSGDYVYTSLKKSNQIINLTLINGHYSVDKKLLPSKIKGIAYEEKKPIFNIHTKSNQNQIYDGVELKDIPIDELRELRKNPISSPYILIPIDSKDKRPIKEIYDQFIIDADFMKLKTKGLVNMYKTGCIKRTAKKLFNDTQKTMIPEAIEQNEALWIDRASYSAIIYAEKYSGPLYKYDLCSNYPAIMANKPIAGKAIQMKFPIKAGKFSHISTDDLNKKTFISYGIYRCEIEQTTDTNINKLFKYNKKHDYYTHLDLSSAREYGLAINMIEDGQPNQLLYATETLVYADKIFSPFVDLLFELKKDGVKVAKKIMNILWGALCEKNMFHSIIGGNENDEKQIDSNTTYEKISTLDDDKVHIQYYNNTIMYETNWARIKPFLISRGRCEIARIMKPHVEFVKKSHTDSLFITHKLNVETGFEIGNLVYEGYCPDAQILNCMKTIGEFIIN